MVLQWRHSRLLTKHLTKVVLAREATTETDVGDCFPRMRQHFFGPVDPVADQKSKRCHVKHALEATRAFAFSEAAPAMSSSEIFSA